MKLTDSIIKAVKPQEKPFSLPDGHGLVLLVQPSGAKWWRYRYRFNGTARMLSIGVYPDVTLKVARNEHARFKELLVKGIDPSENRKAEKQQAAIAAANSFETIARLWWNHWKHDKTERHADYTMRRMEADILPAIGAKSINDITAMHLIALIRKVESRGALDIAKRVLTLCGQVMRYAVAHELAERNPTADIKPSDVLKPVKKTNHARLSEKELPELLRKIDSVDTGLKLTTHYG
ncbi:uncharacterized protein DUF4102 [Nitrosomonas sp. Nm84]|uniref:tyrosine-type recombinase/integrase n=1 Tax=Nitrosomonas sp. Nm84 TaxID=200124 RepID=UPI000D757C74|nr:integrase arm-type DNA-binding domain-containing protein [Nitrosomonas sp. Nm84]PXW84709.1 uncharacterized protein DUF4102 [Nitrosomonas sp. Nm84]